MKTRRALSLFTLWVLITAAGPAPSAEPLTLMLDWFPNVDHLPIYLAREGGGFASRGLRVEILSPSDTADALKLSAAGTVDLAVSYEPQAIIAAAEGLSIRVVGRLIAHPLTTLLFLKDRGIAVPADLNGKRIGYTVPGMMDLLLTAFADINGISGHTPVNVGFAIIPALTTGKVDAVMGPFKTYETVALAHRGYAAGYFELEKWGIPDYDELVFVTGAATLKEKPTAISAFVDAVQAAIRQTRQDPQAALADYFRAVPEADRPTETDAFRLTLPYYADSQDLDAARWQRFADFARQYGLVDRPVDIRLLLRPASGVPESGRP